MFIEGDELEVHIVIGISEIFANRSEIDILDCAYRKLDEAEQEEQLYKICED
jgi:hypothetical protein